MGVPSRPEPSSPTAPLRRAHARRSLLTVLRESGGLGVAHGVDVALDIIDLLVPVHASGLVHGQLGLSTVRLAYTREGGPREVTLHGGGLVDASGPSAYEGVFLAPEQRELRAVIDARADVWAIGALLAAILDPARACASEKPIVPASLAAVIDRCLAADPAQRPSTVDALAEAIASFASSPPARFAELAERRAAAERVRLGRERLARRGLADMPSVLDRLDEAALSRAQADERASTAAARSLLAERATEADLERLMTVVRESTEEARVAHASTLPSLLDDALDDELVVPTVVREPTEDEVRASIPPELVADLVTVTVPLELPPARPREAPASSPPVLAAPRRATARVIVAIAAVFALATCVGFLAARRSATESAPLAAPSASPALPAVTATPAAPPPSEPSIPTVAASALPDAVVTPDALPRAR